MDEYRKSLSEREENSYSRYDTALLSVTSGAIALSVTIIVRDVVFYETGLLAFAWISWGISLLSQIASHLIAAKAMRNEISTIDSNHFIVNNRLKGLPTKMNYFSFVSFGSGSVCFLVFIFINFI